MSQCAESVLSPPPHSLSSATDTSLLNIPYRYTSTKIQSSFYPFMPSFPPVFRLFRNYCTVSAVQVLPSYNWHSIRNCADPFDLVKLHYPEQFLREIGLPLPLNLITLPLHPYDFETAFLLLLFSLYAFGRAAVDKFLLYCIRRRLTYKQGLLGVQNPESLRQFCHCHQIFQHCSSNHHSSHGGHTHSILCLPWKTTRN